MIPNEVTAREAVVWIDLVNENPSLNDPALHYKARALLARRIKLADLGGAQSGNNKIKYLHYTARELESVTEYAFELYSGESLLDTCRANAPRPTARCQ
jgi:hypothetical protein